MDELGEGAGGEEFSFELVLRRSAGSVELVSIAAGPVWPGFFREHPWALGFERPGRCETDAGYNGRSGTAPDGDSGDWQSARGKEHGRSGELGRGNDGRPGK